MKLFTVIARAFQHGAGEIVSLSADQYRDRAHLVTVVDTAVVKKGTPATPGIPDQVDANNQPIKGTGKPAVEAVADEFRYIVRAGVALTFKIGETIGLLEKPKRAELEEVKGKVPDPRERLATAAERMSKIIAAIDQLSPNNPKHFTSDGVPAMAALEAAAGFKITSGDRDEAWSRRAAALDAKRGK